MFPDQYTATETSIITVISGEGLHNINAKSKVNFKLFPLHKQWWAEYRYFKETVLAQCMLVAHYIF